MQMHQQHIINKLTVDVETTNPRAAFELKDNIDAFLKQEIFPYLERYFHSIEEDIKWQSIQISQLSIDLNSSSSLNYNELKEDLKRQIVKEVKQAIEKPVQSGDNVAVLSSGESNGQSLIHFLKFGTKPWWSTTEQTISFTDEELVKLYSTQNFQQQFQKIIAQAQVQQRFVYQFSDQQIAKILKAVFGEISSKVLKNKIVDVITEMREENRLIAWKAILQYLSTGKQKDIPFQLLTFLSEKFAKNNLQKSGENITVLQFVLEVFEEFKDENEALFKSLVVLLDETLENTSKLLEQETIVPEDFEKADHIEVVTPEIYENETVKEHQEKEHILLTDGGSESSKLSAEEETENKRGNKRVTSRTESSENATESIKGKYTKQNDDTETTQEPLSIKRNLATRKESVDTKSKQVVDSKFINDSDKDHSTKKDQPEIAKSSVANSKSNKQFNSKEQVVKKWEAYKKLLSNKAKESKLTIDTEKLHDKVNTLIHQQTKEEEKKAILELLNEQMSSEREEENLRKEYIVSNAGLILLHPYLQHFFANCDLLNDDNKLTDPDLAVHVLHYLATKKEKQYESNMLFEKVLCGLPIHSPIQRNRELSKELKSNSEELLEAVLTNWGALKNASPDLLRNEFLQRSGKINFKEINPKIVVERKVQDILLDRLPWNIGICKLPWINHLLFTDW